MSKEDTRELRVKTLRQTQEARKQDSLGRVYKAIERVQKSDAKITFQVIANEANVSVSYLYKYPEVKSQIAQLRSKQNSMPVPNLVQPSSSATLRAAAPTTTVFSRLKERIHQLEKENSELKRKNEALAGQVYRAHELEEQIKRQQDIINTLETRLKEITLPSVQNKVIPLILNKQSEISEQLKSKLELAGIQLNTTLSKTIKTASEETVLDAIEAYKEALAAGNMKQPGAWIKTAIEQSWKPNETVQDKSELDIFNEWFPLAKKKGLVVASQSDKGSIIIFTNNSKWISFKQMLKEYPIDTLH